MPRRHLGACPIRRAPGPRRPAGPACVKPYHERLEGLGPRYVTISCTSTTPITRAAGSSPPVPGAVVVRFRRHRRHRDPQRGPSSSPGRPRQAVPGTLDAASSICNKVSPSSVSSIVGYTVPAPTLTPSTFVVDKALGISATSTNSSFTVFPTTTSPSSRVVVLGYEVFTKPVTEASLKAAAAAQNEKVVSEEKASHFKVSYSAYSGLGVTAIYYKWTAWPHIALPKGVTLPKSFSTNLAYEGIATLQGTKSYEAAVNNHTLSEAKLGELARLAVRL